MRCTGKNIRLQVNHLMVSYCDEGAEESPAIIFIHGFPFNKSIWEHQTEGLTEKYRVIAYDVRGHGDSEAGEEEFSIDKFTNDLISLMDRLHIESAMLCGQSMGGYIALNAAAHYPKRFTALLLCDTQCHADTPEAKEKRMNAINTIEQKGVEVYADQLLLKLLDTNTETPKQELIEKVRNIILETSSTTLTRTLLALSRRDETCSKLPALELPVLILVGDDDQITPPLASKQMHAKFQDSYLYVIEHAGHLSNIENPSEFNLHLGHFLELVQKKQKLILEPTYSI